MSRTLVTLAATAAVVAGNVHERGYYESKFFDWLSTQNVKLGSGELFVHALQNFANNDDIIDTHNAKTGVTYTLGHNKFSHLSNEEYREYVKLGLSRPAVNNDHIFHAAPSDLSALPTSVDWTTKGGVTGVKDQGQCGSCWSFSTTGALEGAYFNKQKSLVSFSEQNLVDCDNRSGNPKGTDMGCNGGLMDNAFTWISKNGGLESEANYPYVSGDGSSHACSQTASKIVAGSAIKTFTDITPNSDSAMMSALAQQTVAVAIEADQSAFQLYKSGVFTAACGTNLDHGVLAVGYGALNGVDYYKVKNSWGTSWGMDGYILFARGAGVQKEGQCGILMEASYPNL